MIEKDNSYWFDDLYHKFCKPLVQFGLRAGLDIETSKELMHDSFVLLLTKYDSLKLWHPNIPGWLIKANSIFIKRELSHPRRKVEVPLEDWMNIPVEDHYRFPLSDLLPPGLTERHRTILILRYEDQLMYREIARKMEISEGYVGVLLSRAHQEWKKLHDSEEKRFARDVRFVS